MGIFTQKELTRRFHQASNITLQKVCGISLDYAGAETAFGKGGDSGLS
jgi:hypothetical protein